MHRRGPTAPSKRCRTRVGRSADGKQPTAPPVRGSWGTVGRLSSTERSTRVVPPRTPPVHFLVRHRWYFYQFVGIEAILTISSQDYAILEEEKNPRSATAK